MDPQPLLPIWTWDLTVLGSSCWWHLVAITADLLKLINFKTPLPQQCLHLVDIEASGASRQYASYWNVCLLRPANEVWGNVIFSQACVKNSVHIGGAWSGGSGAPGPGGGVPGPAWSGRSPHPPGRDSTGMHSCLAIQLFILMSKSQNGRFLLNKQDFCNILFLVYKSRFLWC